MPVAPTTIAADRSGKAGRGGRPIWISLAVRNGTFGRALSLWAIATICEQRLGTSKVHALRHTFARGLEDAGAKVSEIQARLGHDDLGTAGRYLAQLQQGENRHLHRLTALYGLTSPFLDGAAPSPAAGVAATADDVKSHAASFEADADDAV